MKVYIVLANADMTEGKGPMLTTGKGFFDKEKAIEHIENQSGVMGRRGEKVGAFMSANDHQIEAIEVE